MRHGSSGLCRGFTRDRHDVAQLLRGAGGRASTARGIVPHLLDQATQRLLVGLRFRGGKLGGGVAPACASEPDRRVADPEALGQMPGPGTVSTLSDARGPLDLVVRPASASRHLLPHGALTLGALNQAGAGASWFAHLYSSCCQAAGG